MGERNGRIAVSMPKIISEFTLHVRYAQLAGARLRAATVLMRMAGRVAGMGAVDVTVESEADRRHREVVRVMLQRNYERAEAALMGGRWTREDADRLISLINRGAATLGPERTS